ncbi:glycosyltransferase [Enterovibrio sp. ZSDZ35]|uniref:Glycosyltransferase n=1 Tax=Enterovibrio qingdaonensis TaxID=2899818 RepID=A0ABT5QNK3_9GAMM|nr:glycosyltransferase [Enterovibrio sp. ZSDZ35]MDD1782449.1 glycosyltransferase [Enterovibrio sp. ZSDZ35]
MNKKRITIFTTDLYQGGVAESTRKLSNFLMENHDVDLIVYDSTPVNHKVNCSRIIHFNLPLSANFCNSKFHYIYKKIFRYPALLIAIIKLVAYVKKNKPEIVYSMTYIPNIVNVLSSFFTSNKTKIILSERQDPSKDLKDGSLISMIVKWLYPYCDRVHANSFEMITAIKNFYDLPLEKIYHLDNFFCLDEIKILSEEKLETELEDMFKRNKVLITSGRLSRQKGQWHLIDFMNRINSNKELYHLVILGDGEMRDFLEVRVSDNGLSNTVHFFGNVSNPHKYISKSHAFIFPSIWESFGNSLVEAMALGIPVISTECESGPGYIIGNGKFGLSLGRVNENHKIISSMDVDTICEKVKLLDDIDIYMDYKSRSLNRSLDFDVIHLDEKICGLFSFCNNSTKE